VSKCRGWRNCVQNFSCESLIYLAVQNDRRGCVTVFRSVCQAVRNSDSLLSLSSLSVPAPLYVMSAFPVFPIPAKLPAHLPFFRNRLTFYRINNVTLILLQYTNLLGRSQWPRSLRRRSAAARLLRFWVRIPPGAWMSLLRMLCVVSYRSLRRADH
jgi:hypothetical protein